ncbi:MAG: VWA domain-containing protein [Pseudomonadota bacterium]
MTSKEAPEVDRSERERRWRLALGVNDDDAQNAEDTSSLSASDQQLSNALGALYEPKAAVGAGGKAGLGRSAPRVAKWLGDIRSYFPAPIVQIIQQDALERAGLKQMLMEPEFLAALEADVHLVADLISLRSVMPERTLEVARDVVAKLARELVDKLEHRMADAVRGATDRRLRTFRPRPSEIDWDRTIRANLRNYQADFRTIVPERLVGFRRKQRRRVDMDEVVLCIDQSGSMAASVIHASILAAVMASLPTIQTRLVCFDTAVLDLTDELSDPVSVLFGVQLGGGTDIEQAIAYCEQQIGQPTQAHLILISDLFEGGDRDSLLARIGRLIEAGVNVIVLLALSDDGAPAHDAALAGRLAAMGAPVFSCSPDQFPGLMAAALKRESIEAWASSCDIRLERGAP